MKTRETFGAIWAIICASACCILGVANAQTTRLVRPVEPPIVSVVGGAALFRVDSPVVHDADTLASGVIRLPWGVAITGRSVRSDYDAWEVSRVRQTVKVTEDEIARGKAARDELTKMLGELVMYVSLPERDIDPYDRIDAVWWVRTKDGNYERLATIAKQKGWIRK